MRVDLDFLYLGFFIFFFFIRIKINCGNFILDFFFFYKILFGKHSCYLEAAGSASAPVPTMRLKMKIAAVYGDIVAGPAVTGPPPILDLTVPGITTDLSNDFRNSFVINSSLTAALLNSVKSCLKRPSGQWYVEPNRDVIHIDSWVGGLAIFHAFACQAL